MFTASCKKGPVSVTTGYRIEVQGHFFEDATDWRRGHGMEWNWDSMLQTALWKIIYSST